MNGVLNEIKSLADKENPEEPSDYGKIRALSAAFKLKFKKANSDIPNLQEKIHDALLGRFAGCTLGAPVEMYSIREMKALAEYSGMEFPPRDYWKECIKPWEVRYLVDKRENYTRDKINGVPVDDDVTYTILALLILERYGFDFSTRDVGEIWTELLPLAYTAEQVTLKNLKNGVSPMQAGDLNNPFKQWIGADIRADGFGYAAAGDPEFAAWLGYKDAFLSHRGNGIYGEMFFAAAIAAAFLVEKPLNAIGYALREIPKTCALYKDIIWALDVAPNIKNYLDARKAVDARFLGMSPVHTNNNACLTVFGLWLGDGDFTETISNVVAMGLDNDCTAATAGSIVGAISGVPEHWTKPFNDKARSYLNNMPEFSISDLAERFAKLVLSRK